LAVALAAILIVAGARRDRLARRRGPSAKTGTSSTTDDEGPLIPPSGIGRKTVTWTDTNPSAGLVFNPAPGGSAGPRTLVTEIWYPSIGGSETTPTAGEKPDYGGGPFPVIVFAHGFDTLPATYNPLLASWVKAGFVVVAPLFPDENANRINSLGISPPLRARRSSPTSVEGSRTTSPMSSAGRVGGRRVPPRAAPPG